MKQEAIEKIKKDFAKPAGLSRHAEAVKSYVADALCEFCSQSEEFAQAVVQSDKTPKDCLEACVKGCGTSISDFEVYKRAAQFWFPGCVIEFNMKIRMSRYEAEEEASGAGKTLNLNLDDLI